jgi:hypothetical protein
MKLLHLARFFPSNQEQSILLKMHARNLSQILFKYTGENMQSIISLDLSEINHMCNRPMQCTFMVR